jgi:hypothetical protein
MRAVLLAVAAALSLAPRFALAQASAGGDAACGKVMDDAVPGCAEIAQAEKELENLARKQVSLARIAADATKTEQDRAAASKELEELPATVKEVEARIERLKDTPLERLPGFCTSVKATTPRTCDYLATRLGAFDESSLPVIEKATKEAATKANKPLAREAAAVDRRTSNNKSGSSAQLDPVESVQPITVAGGALSLSGTRSGSKGVGTISVNPLALAAPDSVALGRVFDLSVSAPFDLAGQSNNDDPYISTRLRVNIMGPFRAQALQQKVDAWLHASGRYADKLATVLANAKSTQACVDYIAQNGKADSAACEQDLDSADVSKARQAAYEEIARARREADARYLGIDVRFDNGDPTGPSVGGDLGSHLLFGLAAGARIPHGQSLWDWEFRARVAGDLFWSRDPLAGDNPELVGSADYGGALIFSGRLKESSKQRIAFGVGAEGRHSKDFAIANLSPSNYVNLNLMAVVPAITGADLGLAIGIPVWQRQDVRGVTVNFSTDLGLLDHSH